MEKENNKFRSAAPLAVMLTIFMILSVTMFILMMTVGRNDTVTTWVIVVGLIMLVILPACLCLWSIFYMLPLIEINENGIYRNLFGFAKKHIKWEECNEIAMISTPTQGWLFFSESEVIVKGSGFFALSKYRLKRDNIFLASHSKIINAVNRYAPKELLPIKYKN
ncbi:hypothetical protein RJI07_06130 [Mycoplasmatota bacterium WC30]